jgi:calcineurin-like phosphoesterase
MKNNHIRVFFGGDVFGAPGMRCACALLPRLIADESIDFTVINGENATSGIGLSEADARALLAAGADAITGGNHSFEKRDFWPVLESLPQALRPANFPPNPSPSPVASGASERAATSAAPSTATPPAGFDLPAIPGRGAAVFEKAGYRFAVLNLMGREDMTPLDCPFRAADAQLTAWAAEETAPIVLVDFHAESNEEKEALGLYLAGRVAAVVGTHTHVQTADERVLPPGTAYMTDLGMTGPVRSVIGSDPASAIKRNITQVLYRMDAFDAPAALRGLIVDIDPATRVACAVKRVDLPE